jgi:hypothetical protein
LPWEKELPQWANAKGVLSILNAGVVEEELITCVISDVLHVDLAKPQPLGTINGKLRLCQEIELPFPKELLLLL